MIRILDWLRRLIARVRGDSRPPRFPQDPLTGLRQPRSGGPGGRAAAVALEPESSELVTAVGRKS